MFLQSLIKGDIDREVKTEENPRQKYQSKEKEPNDNTSVFK